MYRIATIVLMAVLLAGFCLEAMATEYHVNWDGTGDFMVIQDSQFLTA